MSEVQGRGVEAWAGLSQEEKAEWLEEVGTRAVRGDPKKDDAQTEGPAPDLYHKPEGREQLPSHWYVTREEVADVNLESEHLTYGKLYKHRLNAQSHDKSQSWTWLDSCNERRNAEFIKAWFDQRGKPAEIWVKLRGAPQREAIPFFVIVAEGSQEL